AFPVGVEWLWLGGQLGVRGRTWSHGERDAASAVGVDLLVVARARFHIDHKVELGLTLGGGLGWLGVWVNGVGSDQIVPRFDVQADLAFAIGRHFALGDRSVGRRGSDRRAPEHLHVWKSPSWDEGGAPRLWNAIGGHRRRSTPVKRL